jgi:hypothetical protein
MQSDTEKQNGLRTSINLKMAKNAQTENAKSALLSVLLPK